MFFKSFFIAAGFRDRSVRTWNPETTGSQMKEKKSALLSAKLLFEKTMSWISLLFSAVWLWNSVSALYSYWSVSLRGILLSRQVAISLWKTMVMLLFQYWWLQWGYDIWVYINGHPGHWGAFLLWFSQTSSMSSSLTLALSSPLSSLG